MKSGALMLALILFMFVPQVGTTTMYRATLACRMYLAAYLTRRSYHLL